MLGKNTANVATIKTTANDTWITLTRRRRDAVAGFATITGPAMGASVGRGQPYFGECSRVSAASGGPISRCEAPSTREDHDRLGAPWAGRARGHPECCASLGTCRLRSIALAYGETMCAGCRRTDL